MDILDLPAMTGDGSLEDAIEAMRKADRRAVLFKPPGAERYELYTNIQIAHAIDAGLERMKELPPSGTVVVPVRDKAPGPRAPKRSFRGSRDLEALGRRSRDLLGRALDARGADYAFVGAPRDGLLSVITRHEGIAEEHRSRSKICRCRPNNHSPPPQTTVQDNQDCHNCNGRYRCW